METAFFFALHPCPAERNATGGTLPIRSGESLQRRGSREQEKKGTKWGLKLEEGDGCFLAFYDNKKMPKKELENPKTPHEIQV